MGRFILVPILIAMPFVVVSSIPGDQYPLAQPLSATELDEVVGGCQNIGCDVTVSCGTSGCEYTNTTCQLAGDVCRKLDLTSWKRCSGLNGYENCTESTTTEKCAQYHTGVPFQGSCTGRCTTDGARCGDTKGTCSHTACPT